MVGPLPLGTRIHLALEMMYKQGDDPVQVYMDQLALDRQLFESSRDVLNEEKVKKFNSDAELGRIMVEGYVEWLAETNADASIRVLDTEKELTYSLFDGRVVLRGKIDLKVMDASSGFTLLMDHKTAISFSQYHKIAHMSEQLMTYAMLEKLQEDTDTPIEGGMYNLLKKVKRSAKAKPPFYERIVVRFNPTILNNFWVRTNGVVRDIIRVRDELDAGADPQYVAYPVVNDTLTWKSNFFPLYHMLDDGSAAERWLEDFTVVHDPYARYDDPKDEGTINE